MALHLINRSPQAEAAYRDAGALFVEGDDLLLIEDACYAALPAAADLLTPFRGRVAVLDEDLQARGLSGRVDARVTIVDMTGFVTLTEKHDSAMSWF
ncbi:sulfurtransferase complex subunit TusB [Salinicola avicenniae]|uniref:sulfurtransferase complex subunit TusB n=1 Tax=Salinicola avicenniae TaxID=2916836 RepID=UPI0020744956|nr:MULTISPECIES: sulfurtransferase complex subunit TusB [unclassified Salinicola]